MKSLAKMKAQNGLIRKFGKNWGLYFNNDADRKVFMIGRGYEVEVSYFGNGQYKFGFSPYHLPVAVYEWMDTNSENLFNLLHG